MRTNIAASAIVSMVVCALLVITSHDLAAWAMALTLAQCTSTFAIGRGNTLGWALALALQGPWATYAVATHQLPFVLTSCLSTIACLGALKRTDKRSAPLGQEPSRVSS